MPLVLRRYVKAVDTVSDVFGLVAMYLVFLMMGVLLLDAVTRNIIEYPLHWCIEMAQFTLAAYYTVGGAWSLKSGEHVRMDLIYDNLSERGKARMDLFTSTFMIFFLITLLFGSISSTIYAIEYNQRNFSMWNPSMVPIKVIMVFGISLMLLQAFSTAIKDFAKMRGLPLGTEAAR